jgi:GTPase-associated protein 1
LSTISLEPIDQALFGYADGHRQIAASFRLPPKDLYLLSSASDLASGTRLGDNDSYLTGLPLPESRRYALFRTWAAPEMPRPGCVWSHALILDARAIASFPAFSELLELFRRPMGGQTAQYEVPLDLKPVRFAEPAAARLISLVIGRYYAGKQATLSSEDANPGDIERAVLAVWSQQWPRLRAGFSFCTAALSERRRVESNAYDVQVAPFEELPSSDWESWVLFAATDAAENRVTPLRRFLWRYGRDLANSRRHFKMLVELFAHTSSTDEMPMESASSIFDSLPDPSDGAVLKRDLIGIGSTSPRLIAAISAVDLLGLLASGALPETPTPAQVGKRLQELAPSQVGIVARFLDGHPEELAPWADSIVKAIVAIADKSAVADGFPPMLLATVLEARPELIDAETLSLLSNAALERLLREDADPQVVNYVIAEMLRRDLGQSEDRIVTSWPAPLLRSAVDAGLAGRLHSSWLRSIPRQYAVILGSPWLDVLHSTADLAAGLTLLGYPRYFNKTVEELSRRLAALTDDAQGTERINLQAFLLRAAIDEHSAESWRLISMVLPELRVVVLQGSLPSVAHSILTDDLPRFYSAPYWDLNKRIVLSLSRLYKSFPNESALRELRLPVSDVRLVVSGEDEEKRNPFNRLWDWF